ncbi:radical SAM protein [Terrihabitans soli]|uniref:Radical SAM protein n=1 Tax=Terrihabitans soli TaxID=708113 RepID=A0A6S6QQC9_9HYPH|nr:PA0069 family radical SAM protein [Terrihabitans soli]BCJ90177.1 radical SAM protein [Terrihabitans soli]
MAALARELDYETEREAPIGITADRRRGRGAVTNPSGRFEPYSRSLADDGWESLADLPPFKTEVSYEAAKKIITRNQSPDISFDRSINPYRGCEHGCVYCFARPTHSYLGLSPGLDFESKLTVKPNAAELLTKELADPKYEVRTMALGTNTDPYQPIEREYRITRSILEVLARTKHPVGIVTKSALVQRDIDILAPMAADNLARVAISITTLDPKLARTLEPRAPTPPKRLETIKALTDAGIPVTVMMAPVIPALNDEEIERVLDAAKAAGATGAGYVLLRLPYEIKDLFQEWLREHRPERANHVMSLVKSTRGGKAYEAEWGKRMIGEGVFAWTVGRRFELACKRLGLNEEKRSLSKDLFMPPPRPGEQLRLF